MIRVAALLGMLGTMLAVLAGCQRTEAAAGDAAPEPGLLDRQWTLTVLDGEPVELENEEQRPHFTLQTEENRMVGYTGCNRMFGGYEIDGELLSFGPIGATKMACMETMDLEREFLAAIEATASYYVTGSELEFFDAGGKNVARFAVAPDGAQ